MRSSFASSIVSHSSPLTLIGYLITLSARARTLGGIVRPICLAVLRLITNSKLLRLLHGQIGRLGAFQNLVNIRGGAFPTPTGIRLVRPVCHQAAGLGERPV